MKNFLNILAAFFCGLAVQIIYVKFGEIQGIITAFVYLIYNQFQISDKLNE